MTIEKTPDDLALPTALAEVAEVGFNWEWDNETGESYGCDFEPYEHFEALQETMTWFRLWTGNDEVDGRQFRFFGSTGAGDYVDFWLVLPDAAVTRQPVVFIGSEGELAVIAQDLGDLLWLFANGSGPAEALDDPGRETQQNQAFRAIAERYAAGKSRPTAEIFTTAQKEFPNFSELIRAMCR
ncbi:hypothetical protein N7537_011430 [Penicillium hordei]|uniref:SMI1/KNR4 family protein n=1 Tax=Penicillium hordei TaxID=40994 RepID=A0AAD6GTL0_9EURO|nr:uncharacterized protein N7537_011430 [Penicillium hordei]KAJ5588752.1 hypothetical protein N7537_011430 [Penicillium hordei]